ncbi:MAG: M20 family peptidase [Gemmatimonadetes bacterium]|nr:M20 family peptidase [Gemmatimonadota bacterium]
MKRLLLLIGAAVVLLAAVILVRTLGYDSRQVAAQPVTDLTLDAVAAAQRLAGALRFKTISYQDSTQLDAAEFRRFQEYLTRTFPKTHANLGRETVGRFSLLYRWTGSDPTLPPIVLMAHQDVVPVEPGTESKWTYPPFDGRIADGYVWGRGAMDDKGSLVAHLEAIEMLLSQGATPRRTVYLALGHDEEVGGRGGAAAIAALLDSPGVRPAFVLDEGGAIATGLVPGVAGPVALVGIAEKGYLTLELAVRVDGGHSSMPPRQTAVGILSAAIDELEEHPVPGGIRGPTAQMFDHLGPELPFGMRLFFANRWLFGGLLASRFGASPAGNAMLRTTTAPTIIEAGVKENVLPSTARAAVNFRLLQGDSIAGIVAYVRRIIDDPRVTVTIPETFRTEPSPVSPADAEEFRLLTRTIRQVAPEAIVVPWLVVGGTDSRYFASLTPNVYRFGATPLGPGDTERVHGRDERMSVEGYGQNVRFYVQLLQNAAVNDGKK